MYKTRQEDFWAGEFGNEYSRRNSCEKYQAANIALFSKIFANRPLNTVIEFGANVGDNLEALRALFPKLNCSAVEINHQAAETIREKKICSDVFEGSILDFCPTSSHDAVLIKGVLIHLDPEILPEVYDKLMAASHQYICIAEYYNPTPVAVRYRGHDGYLFKRDFAGEMLEKYPDLELVDYGFVYHRDQSFPQDDINWFLLRKITGH